MSKQIWKYPVEMAKRGPISIPRDAQVLCVQTQHGSPCMWVLVDPENDKEERTFSVYCTGHPMADEPGVYVGTFQVEGGRFIFHVFED